MSVRIRLLTGRLAPDTCRHREQRDWRLLAFLLWRTHESELRGEPPPVFRRAELERPLAITGQRALSSALSAVRTLLQEAGRGSALVLENDTVALRGLDALGSCDLVDLLRAVERGDGAAIASVLAEAFGAPSLDVMRRRIRPKKRERWEAAAWLDELVAYVRGTPDDADDDAAQSPPRPPIDADTRRYLECHVARCASIDPRQLPPSSRAQRISIPLEDVYISLAVGPETPEEVVADRTITLDSSLGDAPDTDADPRTQDDLLALQDPATRRPLHFTQLIRSQRWAVVLGDPGAGKTTLLHWLALQNARALLAEPPQERVVVDGSHLCVDEERVDLGPSRFPVLVRVADYATALEAAGGSPPDLLDFLGAHPVVGDALPLDPEAGRAIVRRWIEAGRALLLLDGLDEIADSTHRRAIVERVERFVRDYVTDPQYDAAFQPWSSTTHEAWWRIAASEPARAGGNQVVVTSRSRGYKQEPLTTRFAVVEVQPLEPQAIERFCRHWTLAVEHSLALGEDVPEEEIRRRATAEADALYDGVMSHPNLRRLARNPLLLTVLAMVQHDSPDGQLPTRRLELYEKATRVLLARRTLSWDYDEMVAALGPFALWLHEHRSSGYANAVDIKTHLRLGIERLTAHDVEREIDDFIEAAQSHAGLLVEVGTNRYGFTHGTFREFLAAIEVTRNPDEFRTWLLAHTHDARWTEVVLLGIASMAQRHPDGIDALLQAMLEQQPRLEGLLHHNLLLVADCLAETKGGTPGFVAEAVRLLLAAGREAHTRRLPQLHDRIVRALQRVLAQRTRVVAPELIEALTDPDLARVATLALAEYDALDPTLLDGLDHACRLPDRAAEATVLRARAAARLRAAGAEVQAQLLPLGTLYEETARHRPAYEQLATRAPGLAALLDALAERIEPAVHNLLTWVLANVDLVLGDAEHDAIAAVAARARGAAERATGADLSALLEVAFALEPEVTRSWLADAFAHQRIDVQSTARFYADQPGGMPDAVQLPTWLSALPRPCARALMRFHHPVHRLFLHDVAWRALLDGDVAEARALLAATSAELGYLPVSNEALTAVAKLLEHERPAERLLGARLLDRMRLIRHDLPPGQEQPIDALEQILATPDDPRARAAALMLAAQTLQPLTVPHYDLIADALAHEDGLRQQAIALVSYRRPAAAVPDDVLQRAEEHYEERRAAGDASGAHAHGNLKLATIYESADRLLDRIRTDPEHATGTLTAKATRALLEAVPDLPEEAAVAAIGACRHPSRSHLAVGVDVVRLEQLCMSLDGKARQSCAQLVGTELALTGAVDRLVDVLPRLAAVDVDAAAIALRFATHCLPTAARAAEAAQKLALAGVECLPLAAPSSVVAGAMLAVDALVRADPSTVLDLLAERTATDEEMAEAFVSAAVTDLDWPIPSLAASHYSRGVGVVTKRVAQVVERFAQTPRGMAALLDVAGRHISDEDWTVRRAALRLLDAAATAHPGQFLQAAGPTGLRDAVIACGRDHASFSVRRLVIQLLSHFRVLDQAALDLLAAASRDDWSVSFATIERCRAFGSAGDLDMSALRTLLASANPRALLIAATLLATVARAPGEGHGTRARRQEAIDALTERVSSSDPLLDAASDGGAATLRQLLHSLLADLVWEPAVSGPLASGIGRAASGRGFDPGELLGDEASRAGSQRLVDTIQRLARENWIGRVPATVKLESVDLSWSALWRESADPLQEHLYNLAVMSVLEVRVGVNLANRLTSAQLDEFEVFFERNDEQGAFEWLQHAVPDYRVHTAREAQRLRAEILQTEAQLRALLAEVAVLPGHDAPPDRLVPSILADIDGALDAEAADELRLRERITRVAAARVHLERLGRLDVAEALCRAALEQLPPTEGEESWEACALLCGLGHLQGLQQRAEEGVANVERALAAHRAQRASATFDTARMLILLTQLLASVDPRAALARFDREIPSLIADGATRGELLDVQHARALLAREEAIRQVHADAAEAERLTRIALGGLVDPDGERAAGDDGYDVADLDAVRATRSTLAHMLVSDLGAFADAAGEPELAATRLAFAHDGLLSLVGSDALYTVETFLRIADREAYPELEATLDRLVAEGRRLERAGAHPLVHVVKQGLASIAHAAGRKFEAAGALRQAEVAYRATVGALDAIQADESLYAVVWHDLGDVAAATPRRPPSDAIHCYEQAYRLSEAAATLTDDQTLASLAALYSALERSDPERARARLVTEVARIRRAPEGREALRRLGERLARTPAG